MRSAYEQLSQAIEDALTTADGLNLLEVGIRLDQARLCMMDEIARLDRDGIGSPGRLA